MAAQRGIKTLTMQQRQAIPRQRATTLENFNAEERTATLSFASETPVIDPWGDSEILRCTAEAMNTARFDNGVMPVLFNHKRDEVIGKPTRLWVQNGRAYAEIQFDEDEASQRIMKKVESGSLRGVSVGYRVTEWRIVERGETSDDGIQGPAWIAERWEVFEISIVSIPADTSVGVGRSLEFEDYFDNGLISENGGMTMDDNARQNHQDDQQRAADPVPAPAATNEPDIEAERAAAINAERQRTTQIDNLCRQFGIENEQRDAWVQNGTSVEQVNSDLLSILGQRNTPSATAGSIQVGEDAADKKRAVYRDGFLLRSGITLANPVSGADRIRHMSMMNITQDMLMSLGERNVMSMAPEELLKRGMTTGMLPLLFSDITKVSLAEGYQAADATYDKWAYIGSVPDFRERKEIRFGVDEEPKKIPENGEFTEAILKEGKVSFKIDTYGRSYSYTRQMFINDDKYVLTKIPYLLGRKYPLLINRLSYTALAGGTYTASVNLGTAGTISSTTLTEAMKLLRLRKDPITKESLRIRPKFLVVPVAQEAAAAQFLASTADPEAQNSGVKNIYQGALTLISDPDLDAINSNAWYLMGAPVDGEGVRVDFLNGNTTPFIDSQASDDALAWKFRNYFDFGVTMLSTLGYVKNAGNAD